ncbi:MAG: hypothetical protein NC408_04535 [Candidatus Gastranaerophilales bacterium]|nr:hypothetical protein [Candidatus Gastranaerophilales bacterium]MCM1072261.1 hypothetical protein [Bacteroides sp.]
METRTTYIGILDGKRGFFCGFKPDGLMVEEEREVLYPDEGYRLKHKETEETSACVWLRYGDKAENYEEVKVNEG